MSPPCDADHGQGLSECGTLFRPKFRLAWAPMLLVSHPSVFSRREAAGCWEVMEITEGRSGKVSWSSCSHFVFYPLALVLPSLIAHDGLKLAILLQCPEC